MRIAIVSEEYAGAPDAGEREAREALTKLYPSAAVFILKGRRLWAGLLGAWRLAGQAENLNLRGFDIIITLGFGFAQGIITPVPARHIAYLFSPPGLWHKPGLAGHWYRLWSPAGANQVSRWLASTRWVKAAIEKYFRKEATVLYPPVALAGGFNDRTSVPNSKFQIPTGKPPHEKYVAVVKAANAPALAAVREALNRMNLAARFVDAEAVGRRIGALRRAQFLLVPRPVSFLPVAVEAFTLGKPVLAYRGGGLTEIVEEGVSGLFFDDLHPGVIADGIRRMRELLPTFNAQALKERARRFSPERFKEELSRIVAEVV